MFNALPVQIRITLAALLVLAVGALAMGIEARL